MGRDTPNSIRYHKGGKKHGQDVWGWEMTSKDRGRAGGAQQRTRPGHKAGLLSDREYLNGILNLWAGKCPAAGNI